MDDKESLLKETESEYKPSFKRFYIMFMMAIYNFLYMFYFNSWQPIMESLESVFNWHLTTVNLLPNVYALTYVVLIVPFMYLWNKAGLRNTVLISVFFMVMGASLRMYNASIQNTVILIHLSNAIISISSIMPLVIPPVISAIWFPYYERSMATAFMFAMRELGNAAAPFLIPFLLPDLNLTNKMNVQNTTLVLDTFNRLKGLFYIEFGFNLFLFFLLLIYFPSSPKNLPSKSSDELLRISFKDGAKEIFKLRNVWIIFTINLLTYGVHTGVELTYTSTMYSIGLTQRQVGISNAANTLCVVAGVLVGGCLGNKVPYRILINACMAPQIILYILYGLQTMKIIPYDLVSIFLLQTIREFTSSILDPLMYEMACEAAFPINEVIVSGVIGISTNLGTSLFLSVTMIPGIGTKWIPFSYAVLAAVIWPLNIFYDDTRNRRNVDI